jgi:alpha-1,3-mannosyltransferase
LATARYDYLKTHQAESSTVQYFFALDLRDNLDLLVRLIGSVVETITFLRPERCALSIIEGPSTDGTGEVLEAFSPDSML